MLAPLPIDEVLPALLAALAEQGRAVLQAPPGSGKTTRVPLALLHVPWLGGRSIVVLEPRRIAARAAAGYMAGLLGEKVGETVGYRIRQDRKIGPGTRIEVVTEGILTRMLQDDPSLDGVGVVLFDEFHERSLAADLGLALSLEARAALCPDLRLVVMSATIDGGPVARLMGGAPIVTGAGRMFPVETRHMAPDPGRSIEDAVAAAVRRALDEEEGSLLVFLPGAREIRRVAARLEPGSTERVIVVPLYGDLPAAAQDRAIRPAPPGWRKVVLATNIAETSLTIEGVRVVIDGGHARAPRFDPGTGMTRLETVRVSRASADQRRGRAGRTGPGVCIRLWAKAAEGALPPFSPPEILVTDLAPLALDLALWGASDAASLAWLDPPPAAALGQARALLADLGALDDDGRITAQGRAMARLPLHPRLGHMALAGRERGLGGLAADVAAVLEERALVPSGTVDLRVQVEALRRLRDGRPPPALDRAAGMRALETARRLMRDVRLAPGGDPQDTGLLVALAYPDRVALRRAAGARGTFLLANGRGATVAAADPLAGAELLAVAAVEGGGREARVFTAAPLDRAALEAALGDRIEATSFVAWDPGEEAVAARRQRRLGALVLADAPLPGPLPDAVTEALLTGMRRLGVAALPWTAEATALRQRVAYARRLDGESWPDWSDAALLDTLEIWLGPFLGGMRRRTDLGRLDLASALRAVLGWEAAQALDALAPSHLMVPSGSRIRIDYENPAAPVLAVKLQELFGLAETPAIAGGRVPLTLHLLSPAGRPLQVTRDLAGFWRGSYAAVRRDMRGRYPKHPWPEDPLAAQPTALAKPRGS